MHIPDIGKMVESERLRYPFLAYLDEGADDQPYNFITIMNNQNTTQGAEAPARDGKAELVEAVKINNATDKATIMIQVETARMFPRSQKEFEDRAIADVTYSVETAESCFYKLPRKDKGVTKYIEGYSIRLAEIVAKNYGNLFIGADVVSIGDESVKVVGYAWDMETNTRYAIPKVGRIMTKDKRRYSEDMIITTVNANIAKAVRDAIFKAVPQVVLMKVEDAARDVLKKDGAKTLPERRERAVAYFISQGVKEADLYNFLAVKGIADIGIEELENLSGIRNALMEADSAEVKKGILDQFKPAPATNPEATKKAEV